MSAPARPFYDRWRDEQGTSIRVGCRVVQVAVAKEYGALSGRLHLQGEVMDLGRGNRIHVRFDGELEAVTIRPHLVRVRPEVMTVAQVIAALEALRDSVPE